jgi:hypothetical protein
LLPLLEETNLRRRRERSQGLDGIQGRRPRRLILDLTVDSLIDRRLKCCGRPRTKCISHGSRQLQVTDLGIDIADPDGPARIDGAKSLQQLALQPGLGWLLRVMARKRTASTHQQRRRELVPLPLREQAPAASHAWKGRYSDDAARSPASVPAMAQC